MTDFQYNSYDLSSMKVAFEHLRKTERQGFWISLILGTPIALCILKRPLMVTKFNPGYTLKSLSCLGASSLIYGTYIFNARRHYNYAAQKLNRKYSILINKAITY